MNKKIFLIVFGGALLGSVAGPLASFQLPGINVPLYLIDVFSGFLILYWIGRKSTFAAIVSKNIALRWGFAFVGICVLSLVLSPIVQTFPEYLVSGLYLVRFVAYLLWYPTILSIRHHASNQRSVYLLVVCAGLVLALVGWIQYFLYPDLRNLFYLGWDPHFARIFSTILDPNYLGLLLVFALVVLINRQKQFGRSAVVVAGALLSITLLFTYSRGSYLALVAAVLFMAFRQKKALKFTAFFLVLLVSLFLLPRPGGEGVRLERTDSIIVRLWNWQDSANLAIEHPILGIGYNTLRFVREKSDSADSAIPRHAASGVDNSLLFVFVTTGLAGLITYGVMVYSMFLRSRGMGRMLLIAALVHSMFVNSLFYPPVMLWLFTLVSTDSR